MVFRRRLLLRRAAIVRVLTPSPMPRRRPPKAVLARAPRRDRTTPDRIHPPEIPYENAIIHRTVSALDYRRPVPLEQPPSGSFGFRPAGSLLAFPSDRLGIDPAD